MYFTTGKEIAYLYLPHSLDIVCQKLSPSAIEFWFGSFILLEYLLYREESRLCGKLEVDASVEPSLFLLFQSRILSYYHY